MPRRRASIQAPTSNESDTAIVQSDSQETADAVVVDQVVEEEVVVEAPVRQSKTLSTEVGPVTTKEQPKPESPAVGVPDGLILGPNEPLRIEGEDMGNVVIVKRDIYRQVFPRRSTRPSYVLVYPRGAQVLKSTLVPIPDK
jgi:hypothetical protein